MEEEHVILGFLASLHVLPPLLVEFQYNPESIEDNKQVRFDPQLGQPEAPTQEYTGGGERTISFSFKLHGHERGVDPVNPTGIENGIAPLLAALRSFVYLRSHALVDLQASSDGKSTVAPPTCLFGFGDRLLECRVTSLSINETQFNRYLTPVRADVSATLTVIEDPKNPFFQLDRVRRNLLAGRQLTLDVGRRVDRGRIL
jgi:hypothetical protein